MINQELNFHSPDNNLVIKGGCDLFTTKPIGSDRKLFKTIDKHLDQILEDNQLSQSIDRERKHSSTSLPGSSASPQHFQFTKRRSIQTDSIGRDRSSSSLLLSFDKSGDFANLGGATNASQLSQSLSEDHGEDYAINESPFGPLKDASTRKTFAYLIAILNTTYPDHDFSNLQPTTENFHRIDSTETLKHRFNNIMVSLGKREDLLSWIWDTINAYMDIATTISPKLAAQSGSNSRKNSFNNFSTSPRADLSSLVSEGCKIYEFQPSDLSILEDLHHPYQTMWSNYWFIYNKKKKRVCFLYLTAINRIHFSQMTTNSSQSIGPERDKSGSGKKMDDDDFSDDFIDEEMADVRSDSDVIGDMEM